MITHYIPKRHTADEALEPLTAALAVLDLLPAQVLGDVVGHVIFLLTRSSASRRSF